MDVNDNAPWFRPTGVRNFSDQVIEGAPPGTTLLSVAAVDPDKGLNGVVSYSLLGLPPGGYIRIDDPAAGECPPFHLFVVYISIFGAQIGET